MNKHTLRNYIVTGLMLVFSVSIYASEEKIPAPFRGDTSGSPYQINYDDLDTLLKASVLSTGKSSRAKAKDTKANIGTRMKANINTLTALEGNRFYYEAFKDEHKELLSKLRQSLEKVPSEAPLTYFSKEEQLAYWLNLYNVTLLNEIVKIYPESKLDDLLEGKHSVLNKKLLKVAGVDLSLNDIQYTILMEKYDHDPLIMYGLYQGIIGGPNIRKHAFTGDNVYDALIDNATDFVNSNRGTYAEKKAFRVSSLYDRNQQYFPSFEADLTAHLLKYMNGPMRYDLENAKKIKANIDDWKITDLYGSTRTYGVGVNTNSAALQDSAAKGAGVPGGAEGGDGGFGVVNLTMASDFMAQRAINLGRFSAEQAMLLKALDDKRLANPGSVTVTDLNDQAESSAEKDQ